MKRKEIILLIGTIFLILIFNFILLGKDCLKLDSVIDINLHDTMFVIPKIHLFILNSVLFFFSIYFIRMLRQNFKNKRVNLIFLITNILVILVFSKMISISNSFSQSVKRVESSGSINHFGNGLEVFTNVLILTQILLLILMAYSGIKTGMNYKKIE